MQSELKALAKLDYRNRADMEKLAAMVGRYADDPFLAAEVFASGMMRPQWWVRLLMRFMAWRTGASPLGLAVRTILKGQTDGE